MGAGIAQVCAQAGWRTHLHDADGLAAGMERISAFWDKGIAAASHGGTADGMVCPPACGQRPWRSRGHGRPHRGGGAEIMDLKQSIFQQVEALARPEAVLGTSTSSLSIGTIIRC